MDIYHGGWLFYIRYFGSKFLAHARADDLLHHIKVSIFSYY